MLQGIGHKRAFYAILLQGCRNQYAARMLGLLLNRNTQSRATSLSAPDRLPNTIRELWRFVETIDVATDRLGNMRRAEAG